MALALAFGQTKDARCSACHLVMAPSSPQSKSCTSDSATKQKQGHGLEHEQSNHAVGTVCCEGNFCPDLKLTEIEDAYAHQQQQSRQHRHSLLNPDTKDVPGKEVRVKGVAEVVRER
jgi:hypothetical protein